ncbi:unnamed protein product [Caenorhabditis sp. 36 PRJEB53466]|nr:unnamed protein product [Caenorhabditis sp. 36 PRJEB53466]
MNGQTKANSPLNKLGAPKKTVNGSIEVLAESEPLVSQSSEKIERPSTVRQLLTVTVFLLCVTQYVYGITDHSSLMKIQFAASALAFISSIEHIVRSANSGDRQSVYLLYRTAATVFYIACLFINLTHCMEEISDINTGPQEIEHAHNESIASSGAEDVPTTKENHGEHGHPMTDYTLYLSGTDLVIKTVFSLVCNSLSISYFGSFIAIVSPSVFTLAVYFYTFTERHYFGEWLDHHLEPVVAILLTSACIGIAMYSIFRKKQYLLAEGPNDFSIDKISDSVKAKNKNLEKIDHVHASCAWPEGFTVSLKAYIEVEKHNKDWVSQAANDFAEIKTLLHAEIKAEGATEVIVEPVFVDRNENSNFTDPICISRSCHTENVGCCTNPKSVETSA